MHDVAIIGAGVIGSAIARELSRYRLDIVVLERGCDVAVGASKANSGLVHGGYDATPGTLKAKYNVAGNPLFDALSEELDFPFKRIGSLVLAFSDKEKTALGGLLERGVINGVKELRIIDRNELRRMEPNIGPEALAALDVPTGGIVCPYEMTIALAENAATNGVCFIFGSNVEAITRLGEQFHLYTSVGKIETKIVINAAGINADTFNNMLSKEKLNILPRRGQYFLMDRTEGDLVRHSLFQLPGKMGKGVLVTPTVDGNILVGPTSEEISDKENVETTQEGLAKIVELSCRDVLSMPHGKTIASFAGLRAHETAKGDFTIGECPDVPGFFNVLGIESPGLTSAPAIARDIASLVSDRLNASTNPSFIPVRRAVTRFRHMTLDEKRQAVARDPNYGHVICRCESVTKAEILGAIRSPLGVYNLDAIKRRTRAGMGRCQAGFCSMRLPEIIAEEKGIPLTEVTKFGGGSKLLLDRVKTAWLEE